MHVEMESLMQALESPKVLEAGRFRFMEGTLYGRKVVLSICGPGKINAALCAQYMLLQYKPSAVINLGVAGAVAPDVAIGDIVVGTAAVQHDVDTSALGDPPGLIPGINMLELPCDEGLLEKFRAALHVLPGLKGHFGIIATGDQFISDKLSRKLIRERYGALCCEMEGGAIAHACYMHNTACAIVRAISDNADGTSTVEYHQFLQQAAHRSTQMVKQLLQSM